MPLYLLWYFLRIRKHGGETDYFVKRFENAKMDRMFIETQMVSELLRRGLILLPDEEREKVFNPLTYTDESGATKHRSGTQTNIPYFPAFDITPAGKYLLREMLFSGIGSIGWAVFVAAVSAATALFVAA